ncbi:hypothetical protein ABZP36_001633 [Zizania latifolia]
MPPKTLFSSGTQPSFWLVGLLLLAYLLGSTTFYLAMDHMFGTRTNHVLDGLYFCIVTMTTDGYGDLVPANDVTKLLACTFVFADVTLVSTILSKATDYLVEKQEVLLFCTLHANHSISKNKQQHESEDDASDGDEARMADAAPLHAVETNKMRYKLYTTTVLLWGGGYTDGGRALLSVRNGDDVVVWRLELLIGGRPGVHGGVDHGEHGGGGALLPICGGGAIHGEAAEGSGHSVLWRWTTNMDLDQDEISEFLKEFDKLDADHSGTLSPPTSPSLSHSLPDYSA